MLIISNSYFFTINLHISNGGVVSFISGYSWSSLLSSSSLKERLSISSLPPKKWIVISVKLRSLKVASYLSSSREIFSFGLKLEFSFPEDMASFGLLLYNWDYFLLLAGESSWLSLVWMLPQKCSHQYVAGINMVCKQWLHSS